MKKMFLGVFILFDLALIGGSAFVMVTYVRRKMPMHIPNFPSFSTKSTAVPATAEKPVTPDAAKPTGLLTPAAPVDSATRKILFSYRSPHSKQVSIRADFTGWKAEPMKKAANGVWTYQATLTAGQEYAYCYTADDKTFKDPANKRTKQIGRTLVSAIVVQAPPAKTTK